MLIAGTVTRVVEPDPGRGFGPRVFFRPVDAGVLRQLDGSKQTATGEIPVGVADATGYTVGDSVEFEIA